MISGTSGLARFLPDGDLDTTFGTGGVAALPSLGIASIASTLAVQPNGDYVWAGEKTAPDGTDGEFAAVRYTPRGKIDTTFGAGGVAATELPDSSVQGAESVLVEPGGQVETSTSSGIGPISALGLDASGDIFALPAHVEFSPAGQLDSTLTPAAITSSSVGGNATFLASGQYVIGDTVGAGKRDDEIQVEQFKANGTPHFKSPLFHYSGAGTSGEDGANAVAVQPNGKILVGGSHFLDTAVFGLARIDVGGSLDTTFGDDGTVLTTIQGNDGISALLIQPDGKILAIGSSENNSTGITDVAIARYLGS